jgi:hypothetical protein
MQQVTRPAIAHEQVHLVSVKGRLDNSSALGSLQKDLDLLLDGGTRFLLADLSRVEHCDNRMSDLLTRTDTLLEQRGGWLRMIEPGSSVVRTVDPVAPPAALPMSHEGELPSSRHVGG